MNYWVFKANPETYRINERLLAPAETIIWSITRYVERIQAGDTVFVWQAGLKPGFCAVMQVEACPYQPEAQELNDGFEIPAGSLNPETGLWTKCRLIKRFRSIEKNVVKRIPGLDIFSFFSAFQGAINYSITHPEGTRLLEYLDTHPLEEPLNINRSASKPRSARLKSWYQNSTWFQKRQTCFARREIRCCLAQMRGLRALCDQYRYGTAYPRDTCWDAGRMAENQVRRLPCN